METVSDMIAGFLAGLTPGTRAGYRSIVSRWLRWCSDNGIDMLRAKRTHIEVFAAYGNGMRPVAKNTVYRNLDLLYYRSQEHYDRYGRDKGDYAIVNARSREIAAILESQGIEARFRYPEDDEAGFQRLANTR